MARYELTVITPAPAGCSVMHVFEIEVDKPLNWVREHADEMASTFNGGSMRHYNALNVRML